MEVNPGIKRTATICILQCGEQFLLLKRFKEPNKDLFTPIGGKLDPYESPKRAAIRETWEETGIQLTDMRYVGSLIETSPTNYNWNSLVYLAHIPFQEPPKCKEGILEWIAFDKLLAIPTPPSDWYIYKYVLDNQAFMLNAEYDENLQMIALWEEISHTKLV
jgi:8-oxo-dGTP diphosphatase